MKVAVIGAGNGGQAIAGFLASQGCSVTICDVNAAVIDELNAIRKVELKGLISAIGEIQKCTTDAVEAIKKANIIFIVTTATAHVILARQLAPYLEENQMIILSPGRTGGALAFKHGLEQCGFTKRIYLAEAQTLLYACRIVQTGVVNIVGIKDKVRLAALPSIDTSQVLEVIGRFFPAYVPAPNVLYTSLENYGAVFHSATVLFNAGAIERGESFLFYKNMTPQIASFIEKLDRERINVAKAYGIDLITASEWLKQTYGVKGDSLCELMKNNEAYKTLLSPTSLRCRQLTEDIPTGAIPIVELGKAAGVAVTTYESLINITTQLLDDTFSTTARTLSKLGLEGMTKDQIIQKIHFL